MRGYDHMAQAKPTSKRRRESGKTKAEKLPLDEHVLQKAPTELARSKERWRSVFENSVIGVALTDLSGQFIATNPAYQSMLGYTEEEFQQRGAPSRSRDPEQIEQRAAPGLREVSGVKGRGR